MKLEAYTADQVRRIRFLILPLGLFAIGTPHALGQGACCLGNGNCLETNAAGCATVDGVFLGAGTSCADTLCTGACCLPDEQCTEGPADNCTAGQFQGVGSACDSHCPGPVGTTFTYQGLLKQGGLPVTDTIDLEASLWTAGLGGEQVGMTVRLAGLDVADGLFTAALNFGSEAFNGQARFLEFAVRPHDPGDTEPFTTLAPRQPVTAVPYALHALSGSAATKDNRLSIAAIAFNGVEDATVLSFGTVSPFDAPAGQNVTGVANVSLPQGAVVTAFRVCGRDFGDGDEFIARLKRKSLTNAFGGVEEMASVSSGAAFFDQDAVCVDASAITNATIDTEQFAYYAEIETVGPVQIIAVQIDYSN